MLISNVKSLADLERKKKLQQQLLQVMIDNEELLEKRVSALGPNRDQPPPVPPQYKTSTEIQKDVNAQIAKAKENLQSLPDIDSGVVQSVISQLGNMEGGADNYLKLNNYFPTLKKRIDKSFAGQRLDSVFLLTLIEDLFNEIEKNIYLNTIKSEKVDFGPNAMNLPSSEDYETLISAIQLLKDISPAGSNELDPFIKRAELLKEASPSKSAQKKFNDDAANIDRLAVERLINLLSTDSRGILTQQKLDGVINEVKDDIAILQNIFNKNSIETGIVLTEEDIKKMNDTYNSIILNLTRSLSQPSDATIKKLANIKKTTEDVETKLVKEEEEIKEKAKQKAEEITNPYRNILAKSKIEARNILMKNQFPKVAGNLAELMKRLKLYANFYPEKEIGKLIDSAPNKKNIIFNEKGLPVVDTVKLEYAVPDEYIDEYELAIETGSQRLKGTENYIWRITGVKKPFPLTINGEKKTFNYKLVPRYTKDKIKDEFNKEKEIIIDKIDKEYPKYNPIPDENKNQRLVYSHGFGVKQPMMLPQVIEQTTGRRKMPPSMQPEIEMLKGEGFMHRKIKIGRGIEALEAEPRFKTFGKYIINTLQLDKNILNLRYPSTGPIPAIKPVQIDDNFKEFIADILESGKVSQRHYDSLTEAEKAHFNKIIRGAKLTDVLKFKADEKIDDKKDLKRLEVLYGEVLAGNDNDKVIRECKSLIKKCVSNGLITKIKGMDMLMEMGNI